MSITFVQNHLPHVTYGGSPWNCTEGLWFRTLGCGCYTMLDTEEQDKLLTSASLPNAKVSTLSANSANLLSFLSNIGGSEWNASSLT